MKFTLKDYQDDAVRVVLDRLRKARKRWHEDQDRHAFSLTAATGAGKTVMAAAAFEALFHGDDERDFERDTGAVVIWFSDDHFQDLRAFQAGTYGQGEGRPGVTVRDRAFARFEPDAVNETCLFAIRYTAPTANNA